MRICFADLDFDMIRRVFVFKHYLQSKLNNNY